MAVGDPRPKTVIAEVLYTAQFVTTVTVDCQKDGSVKELVEAAIEDIEPGTGEYVDDSWNVNNHVLVEEGDIPEFVPPLGEPYQLPDTGQIREWFYRTRHSTWVLRVADDNRFPSHEAAKLPVWALYSTEKTLEE